MESLQVSSSFLMNRDDSIRPLLPLGGSINREGSGIALLRIQEFYRTRQDQIVGILSLLPPGAGEPMEFRDWADLFILSKTRFLSPQVLGTSAAGQAKVTKRSRTWLQTTNGLLVAAGSISKAAFSASRSANAGWGSVSLRSHASRPIPRRQIVPNPTGPKRLHLTYFALSFRVWLRYTSPAQRSGESVTNMFFRVAVNCSSTFISRKPGEPSILMLLMELH
jgi:hypothetical protein